MGEEPSWKKQFLVDEKAMKLIYQLFKNFKLMSTKGKDETVLKTRKAQKAQSSKSSKLKKLKAQKA
jgi:hypothetical protein